MTPDETYLDATETSTPQILGIPPSESLLRRVMADAPVMVFSVNLDGRLLLAEGHGLQMLDLDPSRDIGRSLSELPLVRQLLGQIMAAIPGEIRTTRVEVRDRVFELRYHAGEHVENGVVAVAMDITERYIAERAQTASAMHDSLTGLPNRALLHDRITHGLLTVQRSREHLLVILLDVLGLDKVNDRYGRDAGDVVIQQLAARLRRGLRAEDTVARLRGKEFAVVSRVHDRHGSSAIVISKALSAFDEPVQVPGGDNVQLGVASGTTVGPEDGDDPTMLLRRADIALATAKRRHSRHVSYEENLDRFDHRRHSLVADLREAVSSGDLQIAYQPVVDARDGRLVKMEALARWNHPNKGDIPPARFIDLAEHVGIVQKVTAWVTNRAIADCAAWQDIAPGVGVAVNLSTVDLRLSETVDTLSEALATHGLPGELVTVELREPALLGDSQSPLRVLSKLRDMGIRVSIDDFGTSHSSLSFIKRLPIDEIKIDRQFVTSMEHDPADMSIIRRVRSVAAELDIDVIAEGVETEEMRDRLLDLDCVFHQGWLWGMPSEDPLEAINSVGALAAELAFEGDGIA